MKRKLSNFNQAKIQLSDKNMHVIIGGKPSNAVETKKLVATTEDSLSSG